MDPNVILDSLEGLQRTANAIWIEVLAILLLLGIDVYWRIRRSEQR